jgi:hypothetical protein
MKLHRTSTRFAAAVLALLVLGGVASHDAAVFAKGHGHGHGQSHAVSARGQAKSSDVVIQSISFSAAPSGDPRQRTVTVHLSNQGVIPVGDFVVDLDATRTGFVRSTQPSAPLSLAGGQAADVTFVLGCKWLNEANNAQVTASTDPAPVPGETGSSANNTKTVAPNLDFTGVTMCT